MRRMQILHTTVRLNPADLRVLARLMDVTGITSRSEAIRLAIRGALGLELLNSAARALDILDEDAEDRLDAEDARAALAEFRASGEKSVPLDDVLTDGRPSHDPR